MATHLELGLDTFGDITAGPDGLLPHAQVIRDVIDEAILADTLGVDFFGVGEHHRADFAVSAPDVVLAAIAGRTSRMRLGSAVTVLSSDDPVRVVQRFATLDAASSGRAEVILGRGSFTESFPLFGYELSQYEELFEEKLDLFAALIRQERVTWQGKTRPALVDQRVFPPIERGTLKTWIGVGGSPESVVRAVRYDLPLMLAIIGGDPRRFKPYVDLYQRAFQQLGKPVQPRRPLARLCGGYRRAGARGAVARLQAHARPDRRRARLAADGTRGVRPRSRSGLALCRRTGNGRAQDRRDR
jgi:alkanesulfonate monooxygenase SsuD/methylene tetrahydromethanopterin reductase-like flavin-dependent oxidoreductase (luciferase family)